MEMEVLQEDIEAAFAQQKEQLPVKPYEEEEDEEEEYVSGNLRDNAKLIAERITKKLNK